MRNRKHARGLSLLLCAVLLAGQLGTTIYAEGTASDTEGLCEHHPEHTAECGYVEAVEAIAVNTSTRTAVIRIN